jgi:hypothetical protein
LDCLSFLCNCSYSSPDLKDASFILSLEALSRLGLVTFILL